MKGNEQIHFRSRRSVDEDDEEEQTEANLVSDVNRLVVRRDVGQPEKESHKRTKGSSEVKRKVERAGKEAQHLLKKPGLDIQADKHRAKKVKTNKAEDDKAKKKTVSKRFKTKRVSKKQGKKPKHKTNSDELSKANLVKALIGGDAGVKSHKEQTGIPEKAYRELVEFMAGSQQPSIETGSKKSDIAKPSRGTSHKGGQLRKQVVRRTLTKKHKRVLAILSKMPQSVLRKYFHLKGLDKYWKVMDNIRKNQAAKKSVKKVVKVHKDEKIVKQLKDRAPKKVKTSSGFKHLEKVKLLQKQDKLHLQESKQHKIFKDKPAKKVVKDETTKNTTREKAIKETVKDKTKEKSQKQLALHSPSSQKVANIAKGTPPKKGQITQNETSHLEKKQSHNIKVDQHAKEVVKPQKDMSKDTKSKDVVKVEETIQKNDARKGAQTSKVALHAKNSTTSNKTPEKLKSPEVKEMSKQDVEKKASLKPAAAKQTALAKDSKDKALHAKDQPAQVGKVVKLNTSQMKSPASPQSTQPAAKLQAGKNKDQVKITKQKSQEDKESIQEQLKAMAPKAPHNVKHQNSSAAAREKPKEIPKALAAAEHHDVKTAHAPQLPKEKHDKGSQVKQQSPGPSKIDILKEKIQKTNNLKFKVAQALLAHCETQNRLRQVFNDVNSSLKKAAILAKAIGAKFGIKPSDIEKMTSEHTEGAVEQFLNKLF